MQVNSNKPNGQGIGRLFKALRCTYLGLSAAIKEEAAFRQELALVLILFPLSFAIANDPLHWVALVAVLLLVLVVELINSAIEALTDRVSTDMHILSGRAKDMGSAAVSLTLLIAALVWGVSIYQYVVGVL
ncbi:diacylglycerol kinase [Pseudoalteromonas sp. BDTF-M6]|uniref:diacylglycerol kinase n=1 Tax=Pseudoalteromonas sp. BDTF-M6 TaxID=2796132 RepID=UPI001BAFA845|nr:diacylglycerol kinase [Pseudoalteromonas sp. BDTF-M6]MBS3797538.1 diacylglycerol kinase [Pseudoalteromonas sp. BDTF-M6]